MFHGVTAIQWQLGYKLNCGPFRLISHDVAACTAGQIKHATKCVCSRSRETDVYLRCEESHQLLFVYMSSMSCECSAYLPFFVLLQLLQSINSVERERFVLK